MSWLRRRRPAPCPRCAAAAEARPAVVAAREDPAFMADGQDAVLELLGMVVHGASREQLLEAVELACRRPGVAVPFLTVRLVEELRRDGIDELMLRLQSLALQAKAARS